LKGILSNLLHVLWVRPSEVSLPIIVALLTDSMKEFLGSRTAEDAVDPAFQDQEAYSNIDIRLNGYITGCADVSKQRDRADSY